MQCFKDIETQAQPKQLLSEEFFCMIFFYPGIALSFLVIVEGLPRLLTFGILISPLTAYNCYHIIGLFCSRIYPLGTWGSILQA